MPMGIYVAKTKEIVFWQNRVRQGKFKHKPDRRDSREISQHPNLSGQTLFKSSGGRLNVDWHTMLADNCSWLISYTIASTAVPTS